MYIFGVCWHSSLFEYQLEKTDYSMHKKGRAPINKKHAGMLTSVLVQIWRIKKRKGGKNFACHQFCVFRNSWGFLEWLAQPHESHAKGFSHTVSLNLGLGPLHFPQPTIFLEVQPEIKLIFIEKVLSPRKGANTAFINMALSLFPALIE